MISSIFHPFRFGQKPLDQIHIQHIQHWFLKVESSVYFKKICYVWLCLHLRTPNSEKTIETTHIPFPPTTLKESTFSVKPLGPKPQHFSLANLAVLDLARQRPWIGSFIWWRYQATWGKRQATVVEGVRMVVEMWKLFFCLMNFNKRTLLNYDQTLSL